MAVKLRLKRFGKKKKPSYRLVAMDSKNQRDGKSIELLGVYSPQQEPVLFQCKEDRVKYWMSVGAIPSDTVARLLGDAGVITKPKKTSKHLGLSKKKRKEIAENGDVESASTEKAEEKAAEKEEAPAPEAEASTEKAEEKASEK